MCVGRCGGRSDVRADSGLYDLRMYACTQSVSQSVSASQSASKPLNVEEQQAAPHMRQQVNS